MPSPPADELDVADSAGLAGSAERAELAPQAVYPAYRAWGTVPPVGEPVAATRPLWGVAALGVGMAAGVTGAVIWSRDGDTTTCDDHLCARHTRALGMTLVGAGSLLSLLGGWIVYSSSVGGAGGRVSTMAVALTPGGPSVLGTF